MKNNKMSKSGSDNKMEIIITIIIAIVVLFALYKVFTWYFGGNCNKKKYKPTENYISVLNANPNQRSSKQMKTIREQGSDLVTSIKDEFSNAIKNNEIYDAIVNTEKYETNDQRVDKFKSNFTENKNVPILNVSTTPHIGSLYTNIKKSEDKKKQTNEFIFNETFSPLIVNDIEGAVKKQQRIDKNLKRNQPPALMIELE